MHIRVTDFGTTREREPYVDNILARMRQIAVESSAQLFFVASDEPEMAARAADRCLGRVLFRAPSAAQPHGERRLTTVADSVTDLYLLARCRMILGTRGSSFSNLAAHLGQIPLVLFYSVGPGNAWS